MQKELIQEYGTVIILYVIKFENKERSAPIFLRVLCDIFGHNPQIWISCFLLLGYFQYRKERTLCWAQLLIYSRGLIDGIKFPEMGD